MLDIQEKIIITPGKYAEYKRKPKETLADLAKAISAKTGCGGRICGTVARLTIKEYEKDNGYD